MYPKKIEPQIPPIKHLQTSMNNLSYIFFLSFSKKSCQFFLAIVTKPEKKYHLTFQTIHEKLT